MVCGDTITLIITSKTGTASNGTVTVKLNFSPGPYKIGWDLKLLSHDSKKA